MKTYWIVCLFVLSWLGSIPAGLAADRFNGQKPNIILILADDLGWADLGCYGSTFYETPELDRLAAEGVRFTDAYAACPVCSPTRASILTGKHPARLHLTDWLPGRPDRPEQKLARPLIEQRLAAAEVTLPELLGAPGYFSASIGKWHLGTSPLGHGFNLSVAGNQAGSPASYFFPFENERGKIPGLERGVNREYLTDRLTTEAENFMETNKSRPFFLYLPHYTVHIPLAAKPELIAKYQQKLPGTTQTNAVYAAMIQSLDESLGRLRRKLKELGIDQRTVIFFSSDNGGLSVREGPYTPATSNSPWRAGKGYLYEGGLRVALIAHWPGMANAGTICTQAVASTDLFPTILELAGVPAQTETATLDGRSLTPLLEGRSEWAPRSLYWHYPHYSNQGGKPGGAVRRDNLKLIEFFESDRVELYDLASDPGETNNLANQLPEKVVALKQDLAKWRTEVRAQMMTTNEAYQEALDKSPAPPDLVRPGADGEILLHARHVRIHGSRVRFEPQAHKNTVGYWTKLEDWVSWEFEVTQPGTFELEILQGCGPGSGGSEVAFTVENQTLMTTVQTTRGFQDFIPRVLGTIELTSAGRYTLAVKPRSKPGLAVMDLRSVTLRPMPR